MAGREGDPVEITVDRELDLKGEVCPFTFVKTKLMLEMMEPGQVLRVIVDHPPAVESVPRSVEAEGNEVLGVAPRGERQWEILVRRK